MSNKCYCPSCGIEFDIPAPKFDMVGITLEQLNGLVHNIHETTDEFIKYLNMIVKCDAFYKILSFPTKDFPFLDVMIGMTTEPSEKTRKVFHQVATVNKCSYKVHNPVKYKGRIYHTIILTGTI